VLDTTTPERWLHPDGELVARMAEKDDTALNELQARHERTAYAVALGICTDSVRAERAVTAAFLDVFRQAGRFVPGEITVLAWLTSLTRRHAEAIASARS
jgi:DNA-directed RNA polymerase specialized sigma24 family protein